jgi:hypothetical protein
MEGTDLHLMATKGRVEILTDAIYQVQRRKAQESAPDDLDLLQREGLR